MYMACLVVKYVKQESVTVFSITASSTIPNRTLHRAELWLQNKQSNLKYNLFTLKKLTDKMSLQTISSSPHLVYSLHILYIKYENLYDYKLAY
jgi:hypothetical protein